MPSNSAIRGPSWRPPGTWGSLASLPIGWLILTNLGWQGVLFASVIVTVVGVWASQAVLDRTGPKDPGAIVIDEGHQSYGVTAEIASRLNEKAFYHLDAPVLRMGAMDVPVPFSPALEDITVPTPERVVENARKLCAGELIHAA